MEPLERDPSVICAHLLRDGYLPKNRVPTLELDEQLLKQVRQRLAQVGLDLVWNTYSLYYAVRFVREVQDTIEDSNNMGLKNNEVAMLVILWSKLVLPKRVVVEEASQVPKEEGGAPAKPLPAGINTPLPAEINTPSAVEVAPVAEANGPSTPNTPEEPKLSPFGEEAGTELKSTSGGKEKLFVNVNELYAEFGQHFGSKTAFRATLTRLCNLQFVKLHDEIITEGIFLDLLVDGYQMGNEIKRSALAFKLAGIEEEEEEEQGGEGEEKAGWGEENVGT